MVNTIGPKIDRRVNVISERERNEIINACASATASAVHQRLIAAAKQEQDDDDLDLGRKLRGLKRTIRNRILYAVGGMVSLALSYHLGTGFVGQKAGELIRFIIGH